MTYPINERGSWRPNPGKNQIAVLSDADCCEVSPVCQDAVTIADTALVEGFKVVSPEGVENVVMLTTPVAGADIESAIAAGLAMYESGVWVKVAVSGGNATITHHGQGTLLAVIVGGIDVPTTRLCDVYARCEFACNLTGTLLGVNINGTDYAFSAAIEYGVDPAATLQTEVNTALTAAALAGGATVTVADDPNNGVYRVTISARAENMFQFGSTVLQKQNCEQVFE